jgi:hypothetical protein
MASREEELIHAVDCALAEDWETAHAIAQRHEGNAAADWLHAVLHKIDGDAGNSRYWYGCVAHSFDEYADTQAELAAIRASISG